jgi:hypothetical protein
VTTHPARWTPAVLDAMEPVIADLRLPVHDPFAGTGERLGQLCDTLGLSFTGTEIEPEFAVDQRVRSGDSTDANTYPPGAYVVVTSPVYPNGMADHFEAKDTSKRHTYRQALATNLGYDRPLHPNNMGRWGNAHRRSQRSEDTHYGLARDCIRHWPERVIVNVKDVRATSYEVPVVNTWRAMLSEQGYRITAELWVPTPGQRHGANGRLRADGESVLIAVRQRLDMFLTIHDTEPAA